MKGLTCDGDVQPGSLKEGGGLADEQGGQCLSLKYDCEHVDEGNDVTNEPLAGSGASEAGLQIEHLLQGRLQR